MSECTRPEPGEPITSVCPCGHYHLAHDVVGGDCAICAIASLERDVRDLVTDLGAATLALQDERAGLEERAEKISEKIRLEMSSGGGHTHEQVDPISGTLSGKHTAVGGYHDHTIHVRDVPF